MTVCLVKYRYKSWGHRSGSSSVTAGGVFPDLRPKYPCGDLSRLTIFPGYTIFDPVCVIEARLKLLKVRKDINL